MRKTREPTSRRLVNQTQPAGIFVKRPRRFHAARFAVEKECFNAGVTCAPFVEGTAHPAFSGAIEALRKPAHIMNNQQPAGPERGKPEIELAQGGAVFMGAVENDY